jgi:LysR family hydrogen peroxide-inducible transcriptional activator
MTLQELRYLVALADKGHFGRAADSCHVGQSTLSTQIKKLEGYLNVTLFERGRHRLQPTPMGERIIELTRVALAAAEQIKQTARAGADPMAGPLRLGVIPTLGPYLLPHLLPEIRARFPALAVYLREDLTEHLLELLRHGQLDALLLALPLRGEDLEVAELFHESFCVALPMGHRLATRAQIEQADLAGENVLLLEEDHCMRHQVLAICSEQGASPREDLKATSLETLRLMVAAGVGCTLLPQLAALPGAGSLRDDSVVIREFAAPQPRRAVGLAWRRNCPREATMRRLAALVRANIPSVLLNRWHLDNRLDGVAEFHDHESANQVGPGRSRGQSRIHVV